MNDKELRQILRQPEGIKLDFKRDYRLGKKPPSGTDTQLWVSYVNGQWDEFIKDIIALTNGNIGTAHQLGRLIIGVDDKFDLDGTRQLYDTRHIQVSSQQIMAKVNSACEPPICNISCEQIDLDEKVIQVVTIYPSPHIHETKRQLSIVKGNFDHQNRLVSVKSEKTYTECTAFVRTGEDIVPASNGVRRALEADKGFELTALNENLKNELLFNLRFLLGKGKNGLIDPSVFYRNFRENVALNLDRDFLIETKYVKRLIMAVFFVLGAHDNLSTQFVDYAIESGKYLHYNFTQGNYNKTSFLEGLHQLQINTRSFKTLNKDFDFVSWLDKYNEGSKQVGTMRVNGIDFLKATGILSRHENLVRLSAALLCYLLGDPAKLETIRLNPSSPFAEQAAQIQKETPTNDEILNWLLAGKES